MRSLNIILATMLCLINFSVCIGAEKKDFIVVIDPGHGGHDYGAIGKITNEKTINLNVALLLKDMLQKHDRVSPILTRDNDTYLQLQERADIANKASGNLFISIHVNSLDKRSKKRSTIEGASVYTLGLHKSAENFDVAKRENAVISLEPDFTTTYHGFDPNSSESYIIFEMSQNQHMEQSIKFASIIQSQLVNTAARCDRGVRQAGFWVLMATCMPSVLVELDFICNPKIEKYLHSKAGQKKIATALYKAIINYMEQKSLSGSTLNHQREMTTSPDKEDSQNIVQSTQASITYKIQILASMKAIGHKSPEFKGYSDIQSYKENGMYKYTVGEYTSQHDAEQHLKQIKIKFPSAFIIEWKDGHRIK